MGEEEEECLDGTDWKNKGAWFGSSDVVGAVLAAAFAEVVEEAVVVEEEEEAGRGKPEGTSFEIDFHQLHFLLCCKRGQLHFLLCCKGGQLHFLLCCKGGHLPRLQEGEGRCLVLNCLPCLPAVVVGSWGGICLAGAQE